MSAAEPQLSVIIASHNRRDLLRRCLDSLREQTAGPAAFEVIVADDGSSDGTAAMLGSYAAPFSLRVLTLEQGGQAAAQNAAIAEATAATCLFLDDDMIAAPALIDAHLSAHREDPIALGVGHLTQQPFRGRDPYAHFFARTWARRYEELAGKRLDWADCYGGNLSAPRRALVEIGGFSTDLPSSEDLEISLRLCDAGCRPRYLPAARAVHDDQKSGQRILADTERFGRFCAWFVERRPETRRRLIGWFTETTPREVGLRRLLLRLRLSPQLLAGLGRLLPRAPREVWFGFVARYTFWLGVRQAMTKDRWWQVVGGVPVLMYHAFSEGEEGDRFVISRRRFASQLRLLRLLRYRTIGLEELSAALREQRPLPRRRLVISIDDGYRDNLEIAVPELRRRHLEAAVFIVSERVGGCNDWDEEGAVAGRPLLNSEQLAELLAAGIQVGAHTRTHRPLPELDDDQVKAQIGGSKDDLEASLEMPVSTFTYPYGRYDPRALAAVSEAGFAAACTTWARLARCGDDPLEIPRIEIRGSDSPWRFLRKLWLGGG